MAFKLCLVLISIILWCDSKIIYPTIKDSDTIIDCNETGTLTSNDTCIIQCDSDSRVDDAIVYCRGVNECKIECNGFFCLKEATIYATYANNLDVISQRAACFQTASFYLPYKGNASIMHYAPSGNINAENSLESSRIFSQSTDQIHVSCINEADSRAANDEECENIYIEASDANYLQFTVEGGADANGAIIYCPQNQINNQAQCIIDINGINDAEHMRVYTEYGAPQDVIVRATNINGANLNFIQIFCDQGTSLIDENEATFIDQGDCWNTLQPTAEPTTEPTLDPTVEPTAEPTTEPTLSPTYDPTYEPTIEPTYIPTIQPSLQPTFQPTLIPTFSPSMAPYSTIEPTNIPSMEPTMEPTMFVVDIVSTNNILKSTTSTSHGHVHNPNKSNTLNINLSFMTWICLLMAFTFCLCICFVFVCVRYHRYKLKMMEIELEQNKLRVLSESVKSRSAFEDHSKSYRHSSHQSLHYSHHSQTFSKSNQSKLHQYKDFNQIPISPILINKASSVSLQSPASAANNPLNEIDEDFVVPLSLPNSEGNINQNDDEWKEEKEKETFGKDVIVKRDKLMNEKETLGLQIDGIVKQRETFAQMMGDDAMVQNLVLDDIVKDMVHEHNIDNDIDYGNESSPSLLERVQTME